MGRNRSTAQEEATIKKEIQVLHLRRSGMTFDAIARHPDVGFSNSSAAKKAYDRALDRTRQPAAAEAKREEIDHLMAVRLSIAPKLWRGDMAAIDRDLRISVRLARLQGLDAPTRMVVETPDDINRQLFDLLDEMAQSDPGAAGGVPGEVDADPADATAGDAEG